MNRTHTIRLIIAALAAAFLLVAMIGLPGGLSSSAEQNNVTRLPRPHPSSRLSDAAALGAITRSPARSPRPHPKSHIEILVYRP